MYKIKLTDGEIETLADAVDHGYFPAETYDGLTMTEESQILAERMEDYGTRGENKNIEEFEYILEENKAWAITFQREDDPHSLYTNICGKLLEKLLALEHSII